MKKKAGPISHCSRCNRPHMQSAIRCNYCGNRFGMVTKRAVSRAQKSLLLGSAAALVAQL